jgi:hypothetical protein
MPQARVRRRKRRRKYSFTPARRAALDAARRKRTSLMTPARWAAVRKAAEANRRNFRMTRARRRAMSINIRKAQKASVEKFQMTEARRRANAVSIRKALAAPRAPESYARSRFNHLQHGLQVRSLEETMHLLGENPKEWEAQSEGFARLFSPTNPVEEKVVHLLAAAVWRRLRLFTAQARWESDNLRRFLTRTPLISPLDADSTRLRAYGLMTLLLNREKFHRHDHHLTGVVERQLRTLLHLRTGGDPQFKYLMRRSPQERREAEELAAQWKRVHDALTDVTFEERLRRGGPEVEAALARFRPEGTKTGGKGAGTRGIED